MNVTAHLLHAARNRRLAAFRIALTRVLLAMLAGVSFQAGAQTTLNLAGGWNLIGNSSSTAISVAASFGDTNTVSTVWKWVAPTSRWAFYAPSLTGQALSDYAASKNYDVLTSVEAGAGFWVNAKTAFTAALPAGASVASASLQSMPAGWNLIAIGDNKAPGEFANSISTTPPPAGQIASSVTTLWAWDASLNNWYFYAPSLANAGTLASYNSSKGYLNFGSKVLGQGMGFWANVPVTTTTPTTASTTSTTAATTSTTKIATTTTTAQPTTTTTTTTTTIPVHIFNPTPSSGSADYSNYISATETGEGNFTLTAAKPNHLDTNDYIDLYETTTIWTFTAAEYSVRIYLLDFANAQAFVDGNSFQGYLVGAPNGGTGLDFMTLPAGRYWIGTVPGQSSLGSNYSNRVYHEVAYYSLENWVESGNMPMGTGMVNPRGWIANGFTIGSGDYRAYIETEGMGGTFAVMTAAQYSSFQAANANGLSAASYPYIYACGNQSGGAATEIECELKLPPGTYYLVYLNDAQTAMGGAANIVFYSPR